MSREKSDRSILPLPLPQERVERVLLVCIRRMAAQGIRDAQATWLAIDTFGIGFRRPLVLLRAFLTELAQASQRSIKIAPCCAMRMTDDEGLILASVHLARSDIRAAERALTALLHTRNVGEPLSAAVVLGRSVAEETRKLARH